MPSGEQTERQTLKKHIKQLERRWKWLNERIEGYATTGNSSYDRAERAALADALTMMRERLQQLDNARIAPRSFTELKEEIARYETMLANHDGSLEACANAHRHALQIEIAGDKLLEHAEVSLNLAQDNTHGIGRYQP